jgi:serine/threonine protein kinase
MPNQDDKKKPEDLQTDPTVATDSIARSEVSKRINTGTPEPIPAARTPSEPSANSKSFRAPRGDTIDLRANATTEDQSGTYINDRYRIEKEIARGGMGRVFLATQLPLGRPVAIKVLRSEFSEGDPKFPKRFFLEASVSSQLVHPNIITIHDYGETDHGDLFMAMEFLDGVSLSQHIKKHAPLHEELVLHIALQIARAVRVAHKRNVIHRDLKPGNVMVVPRGEDEHFIKVLDFGLVKMLDSAEPKPTPAENSRELDLDDDSHPVNLTKAGVLLGSPRYMSPEQIRGEVLDPRTDIYSLGIILFQMITGRSPFMGKTSIDVIYQHIHSEIPMITGVPCSEALETITRTCLAKDRRQRFGSMSEVIDDLKAVQEQVFGRSSVGSGSHSLSGAVAVASETPNSQAQLSSRRSKRITEPKASDPHPQSSSAAAAFQDPRILTARDDTPSSSAQFVQAKATESQTSIFLGVVGLLVAVAALSTLLLFRDPSEIRTVPKPGPEQKVVQTNKVKAPPPKLTTITLSSEPSGARILFNGKGVGTTPSQFKVAQTEEMVTIELRHEAYTLWRIERKLLEDTVNLHAELVPEQATGPQRNRNPVNLNKKITKQQTKKKRAKATKKKVKNLAAPSKATPKPKSPHPSGKAKRKSYRNNPY